MGRFKVLPGSVSSSLSGPPVRPALEGLAFVPSDLVLAPIALGDAPFGNRETLVFARAPRKSARDISTVRGLDDGETMTDKPSEFERRKRIAKWVAQAVMPHEGRVRAWLLGSKAPREEVDDLIQEAYCILAGLQSVDHIERPDAYFFSIVKNLYLRQLKRRTIVSISTVAEIESFSDSQPSPEHTAANVLDLETVRALIASLPKECRDVVVMRKIRGLSQREVSVSLGISEGMVEWHVYSGIRAILKKLNPDEIWGLSEKPRGAKRGVEW